MQEATTPTGRAFRRTGPPPPASPEALRELQARLTRPRPAEPTAAPVEGFHRHPLPTDPAAVWAAYYIALGLRPVPVPPGTKGPTLAGWPTLTLGADYWDRHPEQGTGIVLGPSGLASLDIDDMEGTRALLADLGLDLEELTAGAVLIQGNPARMRAWFRLPEGAEGLSRRALAWPAKEPGGKPRTILELRAGACQDLAPPSLHPEGHRYTFIRAPWELPKLGILPDALGELWRDWDQWRPHLEALCPWAPEPEVKAPPRERAGGESVISAFNAAHDPAAILAAHGYKPKGPNRWLSPFSSSGLAGVVRLSQTGRIHCHHASDPLAGPPHDAFSLFTVLEHGGDHREAVREAARLLGIAAPRGNIGDIGDIGDRISTPPQAQNRNFGDIGDIGDRKTRATPPADDAWPELVELETPDLPRLRADVLPGWAGAFAQALALSTETPPELATGLALAAAAVPCARRLRVQVSHGHREPSNLWLAIGLPPGNRKSAVHSACCAPLVEWEREATASMAQEIRQAESEAKTLQARANAARAAAARAKEQYEILAAANEAAALEAQISPPPVTPQLWTSDATPERLGAMLADQGECMAWLSSEAGIFDMLAGRYSKGIPNLDLVLKAWSGDPERVDRGGRPPVYLLSPRLTIGLSPQPEALRGLANQPGFRGRGLLGRFLYLLPPSPLGFRDLGEERAGACLPEGVARAYRQGIRAMLDWPPALDQEGREQPHLLTLSRPAYGEWLDFARAVEHGMRPGGEYEHAPDLAGKIPGGAARIAAVLHGIENAHGRPWETAISLATMEQALEIAAACLRHGMAAMLLMGGDPGVSQAQKVWAWLQRGRRTEASLRDAYQALKGSFPRVSALVNALELLEERGYLVLVTPAPTGAGRPPSPRIIIRPDLAGGWL